MAKSDTLPRRKSYQKDWARKKAVKAAQTYLRDHIGRVQGRADALRSIAHAYRPMQEAKKQVDLLRRRQAVSLVSDDDASSEIDHSDVQMLRVRLAEKHHVVDAPQALLLHRMDLLIAAGGMTRARFETMAAQVISMPQALSVEYRKAMLADEIGA